MRRKPAEVKRSCLRRFAGLLEKCHVSNCCVVLVEAFRALEEHILKMPMTVVVACPGGASKEEAHAAMGDIPDLPRAPTHYCMPAEVTIPSEARTSSYIEWMGDLGVV